MRNVFLTVFLLLSLCKLRAQEDGYIEKDFVETRDFHYKESLLFIRGVAIVPNVIANSGFRHSFKGIYEVNASLNIRVASGFSMGVGMKNTLLSTQERIQNLNVKMQLYTAFVRLAYCRYHTGKTYSSLAFNVGYNNSFFTNVGALYSPIITKQYNSLVFEPEYSINFALEENFAIGIFASYAFFATPFEAKNIAMQDYSSQSTLGNTKANGMLNVGFKFQIGMGTRFKPNFQD